MQVYFVHVKTQRVSRQGLSIWLLVVGLLLLQVAAAAADDQCLSVRLQEEMIWPTSGIWSDVAGETALLVVDPLRNGYIGEILRIQPTTGEVRPAYGRESGMALKDATSLPGAPTILRANNRGEVAALLDQGSVFKEEEVYPHVSIISARLTVQKSLSIEDELRSWDNKNAVSQNVTVAGIFNAVPMGDGFLVFADFNEPDGQGGTVPTTGFAYLDSAGNAQIFERLEAGDPVFNHYTRSDSYLAAIDDVGYILRLNRTPSIARVTLAGLEDIDREGENFPKDFKIRPLLTSQPGMPGAREAVIFYKIMESSRMVSGLFAWGEDLYLLGKSEINDRDETSWWLTQIDSTTGAEKEETRVLLPTTAASLVVVPGERWVFLEREPVRRFGKLQAPWAPTVSMKLVPASWLANPSQGPLTASTTVACPTVP